ncbi:LytR cell envelope-related transcriptional attenuator [Jatrophihabitans sp. GAS493]|uniref:LytR C-terminal domain-containing protein n=1 Tax=Jatrophihabitans sp. GAS493 TaxID=1907575 RepID=UPI000BBFA9E5|nr:LytR C-terminal domain-containing protein [Jatrophihabitans sp. GAS493]SOD74088.1 LytR cell envelope-related transcriptional attenuator [Jatrophihabitans sp. GAS493]
MAAQSARRPLPALAFLLGLSLLTALVWWRVIHRSEADTAGASPNPTCAPANPNVVPQPATVSLQVRNSTNRVGLAAKASKALSSANFKLAAPPDNVAPMVPGIAVIKYAQTDEGAAKLVATYIPGATLTVATPAAGQVEIDLGAKFVSVASAANAAKALKAAKLTLAPPVVSAATASATC